MIECAFAVEFRIDKNKLVKFSFDRLQLLLVLTRHEYRAMGLDTMHGFMILKLNTGDAKE
ncbi:MAG: hypothetical protein KDI38_06195 [Calditrichaeota bacterium]|nr:hypothetical protein [Calditrichota bacterium]MCB0303347.1 hypothetical protein [Calditrichota bacterium]